MPVSRWKSRRKRQRVRDTRNLGVLAKLVLVEYSSTRLALAPPLANTALVELSTSRGGCRARPKPHGNRQGTAAFHFVMLGTYVFCMLDLFLEIATALCRRPEAAGVAWRLSDVRRAEGRGEGEGVVAGGTAEFESLSFMAVIKF